MTRLVLLLLALIFSLSGPAMEANSDFGRFTLAAKTLPGPNTKVVNLPETTAPKPVKPGAAVDEWNNFLGPGPLSNIHSRTGVADPNRIVSGDGTRSIRYGNHEMNSSPTKHHYHEETWLYDAVTDTMEVGNTIKRVPLK